MNISKTLDHFKTKLYNVTRGDGMKEFMNYDFNIDKIVVALFVTSHNSNSVHQNRPNHGLAMFTEGIANYLFSDGKKVKVQKNEIVYLPKNSSYTVTGIEHNLCYAINFEIDDEISFESFMFKPKNAGKFINNFKNAERFWKSKKHGTQMKCKAELYSILSAMQDEYLLNYMSKSKLEIIKPAIDYIHENYTKELISIEMLSDMCNITPEYFRRIFSSFYGISPIKYVNNLKITMAKELLESKMYSVTEAAIKAGYSEMSHFSREFKKSTGISPSEYKRSAQ